MNQKFSIAGVSVQVTDRYLAERRRLACVHVRKRSKLLGTGYYLKNGGFDPGTIPPELVEIVFRQVQNNFPLLL